MAFAGKAGTGSCEIAATGKVGILPAESRRWSFQLRLADAAGCRISLFPSSSLQTLWGSDTTVYKVYFKALASLKFNKALGREELPDSVEIRVAARSRRCLALEAVRPLGERMELALDAHAPELLPRLD